MNRLVVEIKGRISGWLGWSTVLPGDFCPTSTLSTAPGGREKISPFPVAIQLK